MAMTAREDVYLPTIRVEREVRDALNALAAKNDRTAAAEVRIALRKHLRKQLEAQS